METKTLEKVIDVYKYIYTIHLKHSPNKAKQLKYTIKEELYCHPYNGSIDRDIDSFLFCRKFIVCDDGTEVPVDNIAYTTNEKIFHKIVKLYKYTYTYKTGLIFTQERETIKYKLEE